MMLTAVNSVAETAITSDDENDDSFPPIEDILYRALQKRDLGAVGEHCSMANAGRDEGEEALAGQRNNNSTATAGNKMGNTQGELYPVPQNTKAKIHLCLLTLQRRSDYCRR